MIKFMYCICKRSDLTNEEFHTYWREKHGAFIRSVAKTIRATKYIQSHTINTPINDELVRSRGLNALAYDGVTELWWDSMEDFLAGVNSPEGQEAAKQYITDEANFVNFSQSCAFLTEEHTVFNFSLEP